VQHPGLHSRERWPGADLEGFYRFIRNEAVTSATHVLQTVTEPIENEQDIFKVVECYRGR